MTWKIRPQMDVNVSKYTASFNIKWGVEGKELHWLAINFVS